MNERPKREKAFWHYVNLHERSWGDETYTGRPKLEEIIESPLVVFLYPDKRHEDKHYITLYTSKAMLDLHLSNLFLKGRVKRPDRWLYKIFSEKREVKILGLRLVTRVGE